MIDQKDLLPADGLSQLRYPAAKMLTSAFLSTTALLLLSVYQPSAQAQNCASSYEPGTLQQRTKSGLLDSRIGPIKIVNNTQTATIVSLYHPDAPKRIFKYWYAEPGKSYLLGTDSYSSDWGIQVDEGPICLVGRVASWDGHIFTTFPSRLFIVDAPVAVEPAVTRSQTSRALTLPPLQPPEAYEAIATKQITQGDARTGLISLLRAADLYRVSGRLKEEQRVRDRIKQIRDGGKAAAFRLKDERTQ
ncbi:hypothetical protein [Stenomitos frigidus]|uniref:Uncharacterized protein n=1 Tax=Stenomitos frigidus ULC18 TaxID=2107698 RepID=A0A2T1DVV0_9CYAN|nr:hypothetical protein [Stenomitos frigidus]PSB24592.1 hypothetical protein C7B82_26590 [Stenomitos frigidus ULC18]